MKDWEIIADNLSKAGFSLGWVSVIDSEGRTIWVADAHSYGKRFIVSADDILNCILGAGKRDTQVRGRFGLVMAVQKLRLKN